MCLKSDEKNYIISRFVRPTRSQNRFQIEILSCIGETQSFRPIGLLRFADVCYSKCTHALTENFVVYLGQEDKWKFRHRKRHLDSGISLKVWLCMHVCRFSPVCENAHIEIDCIDLTVQCNI